ncbi:bacteriocin-protection protein [Leptospira fletcheri]|uniref:Bacteriocin-protection protein n=1 Tax=Leptospira fletcheri TaxID=2484981 RepID=A0A4R9GHQ3_9LEPT|nr:YdeI/OmpD-associated family protein [Leptospira fletcheri]TGK12119.1 bacteriocin-protection protein [Leptospira fletcheri]
MPKQDEQLVVPFSSRKEWEKWLKQNHDSSPGIWIKLSKKQSGIPSVSYEEALEIALCYGWIDGQKKPFDSEYWLQKFTLRKPKSIWSLKNREKAEELLSSGKIKPAGLKAIEEAKQNGAWDKAYASPSKIVVPEDFQKALDQNKKAGKFFETLDKTNRYAILFRIHNVKKAETRTRKIQEFVSMLEQGKKIH